MKLNTHTHTLHPRSCPPRYLFVQETEKPVSTNDLFKKYSYRSLPHNSPSQKFTQREIIDSHNRIAKP